MKNKMWSPFVTLPFFLLFLIPSSLFSQSIDRQSIVSWSGAVQTPVVQIAHSAGETFVTTLSGNNVLLTQGFQQPEPLLLINCQMAFQDSTLCQGQSVQISFFSSAPSNASYVWSTGANTPSISVSPNLTTTYTCVVTSNGQTCADTVNITVNPLLTWYADNDADGFGNPNSSVQSCTQPAGFVSNANDCNDSQSKAFTGAFDICDNGIDEDCLYGDLICNSYGCTDTAAVNFNPSANLFDYSCEYPLNCGIQVVNDTVCSGTSISLLVDQQIENPSLPFGQGTYDIDGNYYGSIVINGKEWMSRNLEVTHFNNGDELSFFTNDQDWNIVLLDGGPYQGGSFDFIPGYSYQNYLPQNEVYGLYYNWFAIQDDRKLCPTGWRLPNNTDWTDLIQGVGGDMMAQTLKSQNFWPQGEVASNNSGFSGLPGGFRRPSQFTFINQAAAWWSNSQISVDAFLFGLIGGSDQIYLSYNSNYKELMGLNVRCMRDNTIIQNSVLWSTNETTPTITVSPTQTTTYTATVTQGNQTCTASVDITVNPNVINAISATIIEGETYTLGTQTLTTAGTYTEVFTSAAGCDSTVTLTLVVEPLLTCEITSPITTLCEGESVMLSVNTTGGAGASSQLPANLQQGLVAYYPFNGNANDESGNGNNGTIIGAIPITDRFGIFNSAYSFDGISQYISVPHSSTQNFTSGQTVSIWISRQGQLASIGQHNMILSKGAQVAGGENIWASSINNSINYHYINGNYNTANNCGTGIVFNNNEWTNYIVTNDNNQIKAYVNGILIQTCLITYPNTTLAGTANGPMYIGKGRGHFSGERGFMGYIDDVLIYNRALSSSEIQQLYTAQSYTWSTGVTTPTITVFPTQTTTYTATVSTATQSCTDSITITVNPLLTWYADNDADGFGDPNSSVQSCTQPVGYVSNANDCNDAQILAYNGATDVCDNGIDEDCSGADSTCIVLGCTDPTAFNYNPNANTDDGSCEAVLTCEIMSPSTTICAGESVDLTAAENWGSQILSFTTDTINLYNNFIFTANDPISGKRNIWKKGSANSNYNPIFDDNYHRCQVSLGNGNQKLAYVKYRSDLPGNDSDSAWICTSNLDGSSEVKLFLVPNYNRDNVMSIDWSDDNQKLVFALYNDLYPAMTRDGDVFLYDFNSGVVTNTTNDWDNGNNMVVFQKGTNNIVYNRNETGWVAFNVLLYQKNIVSGSISLVVGSSGYSFPNTNIFPTDANQNFIYYRRGGDHGGTRFLYRKNMNNGQESTVVNVTGRGGTEISTNIVSWLDFSNNIHLWTTNGVEIGVFNVSTISNFNFDFYYNGISANDNNYDLQWLGKWPNNNSQINWSTNETTPTITITPTQTTTYTATVTQGNQTCSDSITITVNPLLTWYADADADGFGNPDDVVQDCNQPQGYVSDNTDCNDEEATTYPGASEICDNNRDENCDGVDSLCFVPVLGCMDVNACNFNPEANTEDNSCILPQLETCNGLDDNCNGQIDEGFTLPSLNAASVIPAIYPTCTGNAIRSANLSLGVDSPIITGNGNDLWYTFTAQYNTLRVGLSAAFGDNSISLYSAENGCLELIMEEHETYVPTTLATGNQILLTDELTVGQTYYVAVHQITGPSNSSAKVCFTYLNGTTCDHYYSGNTGVYTNVCNSFKAQYRANASNYIFNILSATQNGTDMNVTPWSYTNNNANSVVSRLGSILPANHSGFNREYTLNIPVMYGLPDAAGNMSSLMANPTSTCTIILNSEATIALRTSDRCPINKSLSSTIAPDRTVCGAIRYEWEFTEVLPSAGAPQVVQGGAYASVFFLSNIPGVAVGKTYSVRVRPVHSSGITGNWGALQCLRVGSAGMVQQSENESGSAENIESRASSISIYPNPTSTGSFVLEYNVARRGELIFAQESMTELVMMDITGKIVFKTNVLMNGNIAEINFGDLESGLYLIDFGGERSRLQVVR